MTGIRPGSASHGSRPLALSEAKPDLFKQITTCYKQLVKEPGGRQADKPSHAGVAVVYIRAASSSDPAALRMQPTLMQ